MATAWLSNSVSSALNSLSHSTNNILPFNHNLDDEEQLHEDQEEDEVEELEQQQPPRQGQDSSFSTPPHLSISSRFEAADIQFRNESQTPKSPRTRAENSLIISSILESHPSFSVFKKSHSQQSIDKILAGSADADEPQQEEEEELVQELRVDELVSRREREPSPTTSTHEGNSDEWHLSSVDDMESLNWGDRSQESELRSPPNSTPSSAVKRTPPQSHHPPSSSTRLTSTPSSNTSGNQSLVRLVDPDSPPVNRRKASTSSKPTSQVQFSPLSLAPSPLLHQPPLPPPPPALPPAREDSESPSSRQAFTKSPGIGGGAGSTSNSATTVRTILKVPKTPGTGQSVRFSASTRESEYTSPTLGRLADTGSQEKDFEEEVSVIELEGEEESELSLNTSFDQGGDLSVEGGSPKAVASFLSRLQAVIPSPETSFSDDHNTSQPHPHHSYSDPSNPLVTVSSPTTPNNSRPPPPNPDESNIFDTSAPQFASLTVDNWSDVSLEKDEVDELPELDEKMEEVIAEATGIDADDSRDSSFANELDAPDDPTTRFDLPASTVTPPVVLSSPETPPKTETPIPISTPLTSIASPTPIPPIREAPSTTSVPSSPSTPHRSNLSSQFLPPSSPLRDSSNLSSSDRSSQTRKTTSVYRAFLQKRAASSLVAADELGRLQKSAELSFERGETSIYGTPVNEEKEESIRVEIEEKETPIKGLGAKLDQVVKSVSPRKEKRRAEEMDDSERNDQTSASSSSFSPFKAIVTPLKKYLASPTPPPPQPSSSLSPEFQTPAPTRSRSVSPFAQDGNSLEEDSGDSSMIQASLVGQGESLVEEGSVIERRAAILSPIVECSEPNTSVSRSSRHHSPVSRPNTDASGLSTRRLLFFSPFSNFSSNNPSSDFNASPIPLPTNEVALFQPPSPERQLSMMKTPAKARHRRSHSAVYAASPNPFAQQGGETAELNLIQSLLSAQGDMMANTSSQRFILSSLITNLQGELDRKDAMLRNVLEQKEVVEAAYQDALSDAADWQRAAKEKSDGSRERTKLAAMEDLVNKLSAELEIRTADEKNVRRIQVEEVAQLQNELAKCRTDVRDGEIRLRHARASQSEAEALRSRTELERQELSEQLSSTLSDSENLRRERDDLRARVRYEVEERERVARQLEENVQTSVAAASAHDPFVMKELERQIEKVRLSADREAAVLVAEIDTQKQLNDAQAQTITDLRAQNRSLREELAAAVEDARKTRSAADDARLDARTEATRLRSDLAEFRRLGAAVQEELDEAQLRIEAFEVEKDFVERELETRRLAWEESVATETRFKETISRVERDALRKEAALAQAQDDLKTIQRDMDALLDDRDRRLAEAQTTLATKSAQFEALKKERDLLAEKIKALSTESAHREVKLSGLRKKKAALEEDNLGLNIALEAKQHELSMLKRQMSTMKIGVPPSSSRSRSALSSASPVLQFPSTRHWEENTPSRLPRRPQQVAGNPNKTIDTSIDDRSAAGGKENTSPRKQRVQLAKDPSRVGTKERERQVAEPLLA